MEMLDPMRNVTKKRIENFITGIKEIHKALVEHSDVYPRNMMVLRDDPDERVIFDRAQTFHEETLTEEQKEWMEFEEGVVVDIGKDMGE